MKILFSLFFTGLAISAHAQDNFNTTFSAINNEVQHHSKAYGTLKSATETIGHRLTGSANGAKAEEYAFNFP